MIHFPSQLLFQIMNDRAPAAPIAAGMSVQPKPSSDFDAEMLAQCETRMLRQKRRNRRNPSAPSISPNGALCRSLTNNSAGRDSGRDRPSTWLMSPDWVTRNSPVLSSA